ncbi:MAG: hypothetical protein ACE5MI_07430 [Acidimicrobiia bacterium]
MRPAVILLLLVLAACSGNVTTTTTNTPATTSAPVDDTAPVTTPPPTTAPPSTSPTTAPTTATTAPTTTEIVLVVAGGEVEDGGRVDVPLGNTVILVVTSDVADKVHVHGYDLFFDIEAGAEATLSFVANIPGIFEVELEGSHLLLVEIVVQ